MIDEMGRHPCKPEHYEPRAGKPLRWVVVAALSALCGSGMTLVAHPATAEAEATPALAPMQYHGNDSITQAVKRVEPAVMGVVNYTQISDLFSQQTKLQPTGVGTGVLIEKANRFGYLVTNNHVVEGAAKVEVVMGTGRHIVAEVVGTDEYTDLAVLRVPLAAVAHITPAVFADSNAIEVGEPAIAIGTPMGLDFADSVTAGIVSARQRMMPVEEPQTQQVLDYQAVIQTDAAINPGNSGGPLVNIRGNVIGINSSKIVAPNFEGMGFAIPSNEAKSIARQLMVTGHASHPALGIAGYSLSSLPEEWWPDVPVDYGVWVKSVTSTEARKAGIQPQDVIVGINKHDVKTMADLRTYLFADKPGKPVTLRIYRGNQQLTVMLKLGEMRSANTAFAPQHDNNPSGDNSDSAGVPNWFGG